MKSKYLMIGAAVCAALFLFSGIMLCRQYADEQQSAEAFEQIAALVETEPAPADTPPETEPLPELTAFEKYRAVQEQNSDFLGWLSILGTNIDYPVMQTVDEPNFYLKRGFDKQYSDYGVPYVQENCDLALSDNCVIYGHHMNNGTMFADLCKYESEDFYQEHKTIRFDTLSGFGEWSFRKISALAATFVLVISLSITAVFVLNKEPEHIAQDVFYSITISYENEQYGYFSNRLVIDKYGLNNISDLKQNPDLFTGILTETDIIQTDSVIDKDSIIGAKIYPYSDEVIILQGDGQFYYFEKIVTD